MNLFFEISRGAKTKELEKLKDLLLSGVRSEKGLLSSKFFTKYLHCEGLK